MKKIKMLNRISIDGYFASPNEASFGMDWFIHDPEVDQAVHAIGGKMNTLILGGMTYRGFERYWVPVLNDPHSPPQLKEIAEELNDMNKVVFSRTIKESKWDNTRIYPDGLIQTVRQLKMEADSDILLLGSGSVLQQLARENLIDEYLFIVTPIISGGGKPLFQEVQQTRLTLEKAITFASGNVVLHYTVQR
jgi:dihydrofolate reductase